LLSLPLSSIVLRHISSPSLSSLPLPSSAHILP
jgi:hypothetical protein